ncbi:unnamed protein product [Arctia plantaginis]|uniref:Uncharacterized protein n=1 Tax=Arctia plantaginis TaxID=874455 RepID=A0A8S1B0E3_ARCPL|nr:unnamed protein product [Arctia plantaginis]
MARAESQAQTGCQAQMSCQGPLCCNVQPGFQAQGGCMPQAGFRALNYFQAGSPAQENQTQSGLPPQAGFTTSSFTAPAGSVTGPQTAPPNFTTRSPEAKKVEDPSTTAVPWQSMKAVKNSLIEGYMKITNVTQMSSAGGLSSCAENAIRRMRLCMSCPNLVPGTRLPNLRIHSSLRRTRSLICEPTLIPKASMLLAQRHIQDTMRNLCAVPSSMLNSRAFISKRDYSSKPCPCPCGCGCGCLPPPCNTPPKCIQYMTGYYYYPYGFWFCGPYHVSGTCCPCGPCSPGKGGVCCACKCCACFPGVCGVVTPQANPRSFSNNPFANPQTFPQVIDQQTLSGVSSPANRSKSPFYYPSMQFKPLSATTSQPQPSIKSATTSDIGTSAHVQTNSSSNKASPRKSVISKLFPFKSQSEPQTPKKPTCLICPYSTRSGEKIESEFSSYDTYSPPISLAKPDLRPVDPFPMYPKKHISGSYSRSFNKPPMDRSNAKQKATNKFSGEVCPPLDKP